MKFQLNLLIFFTILKIGFTFDPKFYGEWSLWHSNIRNKLLSNKIIVSLYPENNFEYVEYKKIGPLIVEYLYDGNYKIFSNNFNINKDIGNVIFRQKNLKIKLISIFGIGFDELPIICNQSINKKVRLNYNIIGKDDIFLNKYNNYFHLIRHTRSNDPNINVPLSTLLLSNIIGLLFSYFLHKNLHLLIE
jgi:hypothetical protein